MSKTNPLTQVDAYKLSHHGFMDPLTEYIYANQTPRGSSYLPVLKKFYDDKSVIFGLQHFIIDFLINDYNNGFFNLPKETVIKKFKRRCDAYLGKDNVDMTRFEELHDLGYLPIHIKALPEGSRVNVKVPYFTIINTHPKFAWLTNYLETIISCETWKPITNATIAFEFRKMFNKFAMETVGNTDGVCFQGHGFEFRGMSGRHDAAINGAAFLLSFMGTDTIPAIDLLEDYYNADAEKELIAASVPASEHSVSSLGTALTGELDFFRDAITKHYPTGIVSLVSDTYDYFKVITEYVTILKDDILNRQPNELGLAKVVFRPDCLDDQTQILTLNGWKFFKNLTSSDMVGQINNDKELEFVKPLEIIDQPYVGDMYHIRDFHGKIDLMITPNHRVVSYNNDTGEESVKFAEDYNQNHHKFKKLRSPKYSNIGNNLSWEERFLIALQADGCIKSTTKNGIRIEFNFQKERKHIRLVNILNNLKYDYKISYPISRQGQSTFSILVPLAEVCSKTFDWVDISKLSSNWAEQFIEELKHWDSSIRSVGRFKYDTTVEENIKIVEYIAIAAGKGWLASRSEDNRKDIFSDIYTAHILDDHYIGGQAITKTKTHYDGRVYCVKVPSGKILVKRNRGICVTGNSGNPVDIICGIQITDLSDKPDLEYVKLYMMDTIVDRERVETPHGEMGNYEVSKYFKYKNRVYSIKIEIDWNRYDKQYYYIDGHRIVSCEEVELTPQQKGSVECLWEIFGGTVSEQGYKTLNQRVGLIYGDSITQQRAYDILTRLKEKRFASNNIVFGVGSYTLNLLTRDCLGMAIKATWAQVDGVGYDIYKDPITDDGLKKSAKGRLRVDLIDGEYVLKDQCTLEEESGGELKTVFLNGKLVINQTLSEIRQRLAKSF